MVKRTRNSEAAESDGQDERRDGRHGVASVGDEHEENGLHAEAAAVEDFAYHCRRENVVAPQVIGEMATDRHDDRHYQVRQRR